MREERTSKMQKILDDAEREYKEGDTQAAFLLLIEAIKLLSRGQQQVMGRIDYIGSQNPFVGGCE